MDLIDDERRGKAGIVLGLTVGQMVGFDIPYWLKCLQVRPLVMLGRFSDADERLARLFQAEQAGSEQLHQGIPHWYAVELAWFRNDTLGATRHANQLARFATRASSPVLDRASRVSARGWRPRQQETSRQADGFFQRALDASRHGKAALELEARILAFQADNLMRADDARRAGEVAAEAIGVAKRKADRMAECHASVVAAWAVSRSGSHTPGRHVTC